MHAAQFVAKESDLIARAVGKIPPLSPQGRNMELYKLRVKELIASKLQRKEVSPKSSRKLRNSFSDQAQKEFTSLHDASNHVTFAITENTVPLRQLYYVEHQMNSNSNEFKFKRI